MATTVESQQFNIGLYIVVYTKRGRYLNDHFIIACSYVMIVMVSGFLVLDTYSASKCWCVYIPFHDDSNLACANLHLPLLLSYSSSESDMEEEDQEEEEQHEEEEQQDPPSPSDLGGVPWKEAVELHAKLKTDSDPGAEGEDGEGEDETHGHIARDLEVEEEEDDEEEEEDDEAESTDGKHLFF